MQKSTFKIVTVLITVTSMLAAVSAQTPASSITTSGQTTRKRNLDERLERTFVDFNSSGKSMDDLLLEIAYKYRLPMALESVTSDSVRCPISLRLKQASLKSIITGLVDRTAGFHVDFTNELVDIYSPAARLDVSNPFNEVVKKFDVSGADTHAASVALFCSIGRQKPNYGGCASSIALGQWGGVEITLHLQNQRVYEILNAIIAQNGEALWAPVPTAAPRPGEPSFSKNFWYIYPLDAGFESTAFERLKATFPEPPPGKSTCRLPGLEPK